MNEIAKRGNELSSLIQGDGFREQVAQVVPKHLSPQTMVMVGLTAIRKNKKLAACTPESFVSCMLELAQWGLTPDGHEAYLIPRGKECTTIISYKGLVRLCYDSEAIERIHADVVCENDSFKVSLGEVTEHLIDFGQERGKIIGAYVLVDFSNGRRKSEVMSIKELESIRKRSQAGSSGPWKTDFGEMAKKTVFRRCVKWLPIERGIADAFLADGDVAKPIGKAQAKEVESDEVTALWE